MPPTQLIGSDFDHSRLKCPSSFCFLFKIVGPRSILMAQSNAIWSPSSSSFEFSVAFATLVTAHSSYQYDWVARRGRHSIFALVSFLAPAVSTFFAMLSSRRENSPKWICLSMSSDYSNQGGHREQQVCCCFCKAGNFRK